MSKLYLLDCTLRDGGYVNDWKFGAGSIKSIFSRLDSAGVDAIELGFLDERRSFDPDRSIFPDTESVELVLKNLSKPHALVVTMIDFGTFAIEKLSPASESSIDAIRVIFKKHKQDDALEYIRQIKEKGYKIIINPVSITSYSDEEIYSIVNKINKLDPYAVTIVDTYGLMHSNELLHYCDLMNNNLKKDIILGYHAHNNFQLAYANTIAVMNSVKDRDLSIDGTLFGMGKSAGNACTELIAMYMNDIFGKQYDLNQLQEAIDIDIQKEYAKHSWGYRPLFYISAMNDCHPNYVEQFLHKKTLSIKSVNHLLEKIPEEKKLLYDKEFAEIIYKNFQNNAFDDTDVLKELASIFNNRETLLLGPGKNLFEEQHKILDYIKAKNPIIISVNFLSKRFAIDYVFMGNAKRYSQFFNKIYIEDSKTKLICTSNITETRERIDFMVDYSQLLSDVDAIRDNPLIMFLHLLVKLGQKNVVLAGFDGYDGQIENNYYKEYIPLLYCPDNLVERNQAIVDQLASMHDEISITSLTTTRYL